MAKTETKTDTKTIDFDAVKLAARRGTLAYVGLYGAAFEMAKTRFENAKTQLESARKNSGTFFDTLVAKGEELEAKAGDMMKDTQEKVSKTYEEGTERVKSVLPKTAANRVEELEAEIATLNKKIVAMSKKSRPAAKKTTTTKAKKAA